MRTCFSFYITFSIKRGAYLSLGDRHEVLLLHLRVVIVLVDFEWRAVNIREENIIDNLDGTVQTACALVVV